METYFIPSTYYSDIPNKRAGHNKQVGWNDLLVYVKVGNKRVITSKPVVLRDPITELPTLVERKSKQMAFLRQTRTDVIIH